MLMEAGRSPFLADARVLRPLAGFGLVHGCHEWLEMFLDRSDWLVFQNPVLVAWLRIGVLVTSFSLLALFAFRVLQPQRQLSRRQVFLWVAGILVYALVLIFADAWSWSGHADYLTHLDARARYFLATPAAVLAGIAFQRQARQARQQGRADLGAPLLWVAWSFGLYAFTQVVVPPLDIFPGNWLNTANFVLWTGFPIQVVRAVLAMTITISLVRATQIAEEERQRQFVSVQQARVEALEQVQRELEAREALRQELLRHTVIAQEEERVRIARELHDETSQTLTAFSLHLAALRDAAPDCPEVEERLGELQSLSRNISEGVYRLIYDLRPAHLDDLGLAAALQYLVGEAQRQLGLRVQLQVEGDLYRLDPLVETVYFRVAQESLTNVARHAGVSEATIELLFDPQETRLRICDQGSGFDPKPERSAPHGWGLAGMRERAESVGAELHLQSAPGQGTVIEVVKSTVVAPAAQVAAGAS